MSRIEGQLLISKSTPHTLKYYAGGTEYWAVAASTYVAGETIKKGQILSIKKDGASQNNTVKKAQWPDDLTDVIGVALNDANSTFEVRVLNYGYIELTRADLENLFVTQSDITVGPALTGTNYYSAFGTMTDGGGGNGWSTSTWNGNGAPIYWYQGRLLKTGASTYAMQQPTSKQGYLTLSTPSGYKYPDSTAKAWADDSFGVSYEQLPIIGNVLKYTYDGSNNIDSMIIHVNFSKFDRRVSFSYPSSGLYEFDASAESEEIEIRHGLFTESSILPHTDLNILGSADSDIDGDIIKIHPGYDNTKADSKTKVTIASDTAFNGKMIGEVRYIL